MAKQRYTPQQIADALHETRGMVFLAAKKLGCSDETIYNYAKRYKAVGDALRQQRGQFVDMAELKLWNAVNEGEAWAVQFALRTLGKGRGYVERQEVTGSDGGELVVRVVYADVGIDTAAPTFGAADSHSGSAAV